MDDYDGMLQADGFEGAILGVAYRAGGLGPMLAYDYEKCVQILIEREEWTREEAAEWMDYNVVCAWVGEGTPIFIYIYDPMGEYDGEPDHDTP